MAAFGRLYTNWAIPVFAAEDFKALLSSLDREILVTESDLSNVQVHVEKKQAQRELMYYAEVPLLSYKFSIGEFLFARDFLAMNGFEGTTPSLVFRNEPSFLEKMEPVLKVGFVHTDEKQGFEKRKPQIALKIAQPKMTTSLRGKRSKTKGIIIEEMPFENQFIVPASKFACASKIVVRKHCS